jgi:hypothetical protein
VFSAFHNDFFYYYKVNLGVILTKKKTKQKKKLRLGKVSVETILVQQNPMGICWGQMWEYHHEMDTPNVQ